MKKTDLIVHLRKKLLQMEKWV